MILVETPLNDARTQAVIDRVKQLAPGKPIRTAVKSHAHFDSMRRRVARRRHAENAP